jgi:hypothetical protein
MRAWLWSVVHNCMIHPLMPFVSSSTLEKAHDWTARKAYPHSPHTGVVGVL